MDKLMTWWEGHEPREQMVFSIVGVVLAMFLFYFFAVDPMMSWHAKEKDRLERTVADVGEVRELAARVQAKKKSGAGKKSNQGLAVLIDKSLRENELTMRGFQPGSKQDARLRLENAAYSDLAQWLYDLEYRHGVNIEDLSLTPAKLSGRLMVSLRVSQN